MADKGRSEFCVVFTMSLCALELKQTLISYAALEFGKQALKSYLKITCEFHLRTLPNKKVSTARLKPHEVQTALGPPSLA